MVKVSVIIPVHNRAQYLRECLDSVCGQTLKEIEIICVDDGSTDAAPEILREYQKKDPRIRIVSHEASTAGAARNFGMSFAFGEYLAFWDSDDFFDLTALEKLYAKAKEVDADVVVCGGNQFREEENKTVPVPTYLRLNRVPEGEVFNRYTNPDHYLDFTNMEAWNKLVKRAFAREFSLHFHTARYGEDVFFTETALGSADRIITLNEPLVTYRVNAGGSLSSLIDQFATDAVQVWLDTGKALKTQDGFGARSFANKALYSLMHTVSNLKSRDALGAVLEILQQYGLRELGILEREEGYYYEDWLTECVPHLWQDTPAEFAAFLRNIPKMP